MTTLFDYLASIHGYQFLGLYMGWIGLVLAVTYLYQRFVLERPSTEAIQLPENPDPYHIAYLRSTEEAIRLGILSLLNKKLLQKSKTDLSLRKTSKKATLDLHSIEKLVYLSIEGHPRAFTILKNATLHYQVDRVFRGTKREMEAEGFFRTDNRSFIYLRAIAISLILGLGLLKLYIAITSGYHNVLFLMGLAALGTFHAWRLTKAPRLSPKGKKCLKDFKLAYGTPGPFDQEDAHRLLLALSVAGVTALRPDLMESLHLDFSAPASTSSNGGCSSCGSGCGGCGGGCGGCGG